ncbi:N-acyl amino acid synthase FeeM domain-containing protein [Sorangium sp. So ce1151]|uniref:N-acyl amino acid synthase FeeM domain-containing protein n=1 Tax=Sorangium sp. So ce1151 TaxID=3133332 RepID=UPI003F5FCA39
MTLDHQIDTMDDFTPSRRYGSDGVRKAETPDEFEDLHRILTEVYVREFNWLDRDVTRMEEDPYHPYSTYLMAYAGPRAIGMMRLVHDSPIGLPIEQFVDVSDLKQGRTVIECQRLMVLPDHRSHRNAELPFGPFGALVKATVHHCLLHRRDYIIADCFRDTRTTPLRQLMAIGFVETGRDFRDHELAEAGLSTALLLKMEDLHQLIRRRESRYFRYLTPRFEGFAPPES